MNDYNDDDGLQTLRHNNNFNDYNDGHVQQTTKRGFTISFRDIKETIRSFDGTNVLPIRVWIEKFGKSEAVMG